MKNLKEIKPLIRFIDEKGKLIFASIMIFISGIIGICSGYLNGAAVEAITKVDVKMALIYLLIYFVLEITFDGIFIQIANSALYKIESKITRKLGYETYNKTLVLPSKAFEEHSSGEFINRITSDADCLSFSFGRLLHMFSELVAAFIIIIYVFINSWIIGVEIIVFLIIFFIVIKKYNPKVEKIHNERKKGQDKFASLTNESIRGIREIKTLGIRNNLMDNMKEIIKDIFATSKKEIDINNRFNIITRLLRSMLEVGTFIICVILLYYDKITLTFFIAMTYYVYRYMWLIENLNDLTITYQKTIVSIKRVNEILLNKLYEDDKYGNKELTNNKGIIEFKNVSFTYPNQVETLNNFNLKLEPNKKIAIIGKSGQGKSTLFNLLTRIFDVDSGEILIDGVNIKDLTEDNLRKQISIIRQEPFVFNRSIKENFEIVRKDITLEEIREYCKEAYIDEYIMNLDNKYDTILGEGGINLSGGQKQRLAIARTLSKKGKIILFDEATSALDNESQAYIKKAIDKLVKTHTVVIIAHRLSTIEDADIIYVIDKSKVVASGKHNELLKTNKIYQNLYEKEALNSK